MAKRWTSPGRGLAPAAKKDFLQKGRASEYVFQFSLTGKNKRQGAVAAFFVNKYDRSLPKIIKAQTPEMEREIKREMNAAMRDLRRDVEIIYQTYAPQGRTGDLRRSVNARIDFRGGVIRIIAYADARHGGFAYAPVTRFGHRAERIFPKRSRRLVFVGRGGRLYKLPYVKGYRPKSDWVADADPLIQASVRSTQAKISRRVGTVVTRP